MYAMPWDSGPVVMFYRRTSLNKRPAEPHEVEELIQTFEDYYEAAKIIKEKTSVYMF